MSAPPPGYPPGPPTGPPSGPIPIGPPSGPIPVGPHTGPHTGPQPALRPPGQQSGPPPGAPHLTRPGFYPAPLQQIPQPGLRPRQPSQRWIGGLLAGIALLIAGAAAVVGTFQKTQSFRSEIVVDDERSVQTADVTWWEITRSSGPTPELPPYGIIAIVAAGLLLIAAVLSIIAFAGRRPGVVTGARVGAALGIGVLAGAVSILLMEAVRGLANTNEQQPDPGETLGFEIGIGIWLPVGAVVLGLLALALLLTRIRTPAVVRLEPDTPRMGFQMPYGQLQYPVAQPTTPPAPHPAQLQQPVQHGQQSLPRHPVPSAPPPVPQQPDRPASAEQPADLTQPVSSADTGPQPVHAPPAPPPPEHEPIHAPPAPPPPEHEPIHAPPAPPPPEQEPEQEGTAGSGDTPRETETERKRPEDD